jgi:DNA-binding HxlR family transcriptional regulator
MRRTRFDRMNCSIARSLEVMGDWWTPLILRDLYVGVRRFDALTRDLGISRNLLASRLASLEENGLVEKRQYEERPPRYEYELTPAASELVPVLMALSAWGDRWVGTRGGPPVRFRHRSCGKTFVPRVSCPECKRAVKSEDVDVLPGPGGRSGHGTRVLAKVLSGAAA